MPICAVCVSTPGKREAKEKARQEREKRMADAELLAEKRGEKAAPAAGATPGRADDAGPAGAGSGVVNPPPGPLRHGLGTHPVFLVPTRIALVMTS